MARDSIGLPKLGDPPVYVCRECDQLFPNDTLEDLGTIHRHLIMHVPDSTRRWGLMDAWQEAQRGRNDSAFA